MLSINHDAKVLISDNSWLQHQKPPNRQIMFTHFNNNWTFWNVRTYLCNLLSKTYGSSNFYKRHVDFVFLSCPYILQPTCLWIISYIMQMNIVTYLKRTEACNQNNWFKAADLLRRILRKNLGRVFDGKLYLLLCLHFISGKSVTSVG